MKQLIKLIVIFIGSVVGTCLGVIIATGRDYQMKHMKDHEIEDRIAEYHRLVELGLGEENVRRAMQRAQQAEGW